MSDTVTVYEVWYRLVPGDEWTTGWCDSCDVAMVRSLHGGILALYHACESPRPRITTVTCPESAMATVEVRKESE